MAKLTEEQTVQKEHVWLMKEPKYCLYSGIIMLGKTSVVDNVPTACTDGVNKMYGRKFVAKLSHQKVRGLILHENLHVAFRHLTMWKALYEIWPRGANMACDYVINLMIYDSDPEGKEVALPDGGLLDERFRGMDAGQVFRILQQEKKDKGKGKCDKPEGEGGEPGDGGGDAEDGDGDGGGMDEHDWEAAKEMTDEEKETLAKDIDQALRQGALLAGKMQGNVPREISEQLKSKVDWREAMREFITAFSQDKDESTWRKPNRRWIDEDVYLPSLIGECVGRGIIAIDMSGSIGPKEIGLALGAAVDIFRTVKPEGVDLLYWDTEVCQHEKYERDYLDTLMQTTKPKGGGGTSPSCITEYIKDKGMKPEWALIITDGYVGEDWGGVWSCPTLWVVTTDGIVAGNGKTIYLKED